MKNFLTLSFLMGILTAAFGAAGCSDLKDSLPATTQAIGVHPEGWASKSSSEFHGITIRANNWDFENCKTCHGSNYTGGTAQVSCLSCHTGAAGPENCSTCHGSSSSPAPPSDINGNTSTTARGVGAHQVHLIGTSRARPITCAECHQIPGAIMTPGHVDSDLPAEISLTNYLANLSTNVPGTQDYDASIPQVIPNASYDAVTVSCANTYCHGTFKNANSTNAPVWTNSATAACGTCHGDPNAGTLAQKALPKTSAQGGTHPNNLNCFNCHGDVVNANLSFVDPSKHINGRLNVFGSERIF